MRDDEDFRRQCEARDWLRRGYTTAEKIAELKTSIIKARGFKAAERLIQEMRDQWANRREWLNGKDG